MSAKCSHVLFSSTSGCLHQCSKRTAENGRERKSSPHFEHEARYSRDQSFAVVRSNSRFAIVMAAGSIAGAYFGTRLLTVVPATVIVPILAAILVVSAIKIWRHR